MIRFLDDSNPDGVITGQTSASKFAMWGAAGIPQRSVPMQATIQGGGGGQVVVANFPLTSAGAVSLQSDETAWGITPTTGTFCTTADFLLGVILNSTVGTVGVAGSRIVGSNGFNINFINPSASNYTPANQQAVAIVAQGVPIVTQVYTPPYVAPLTSSEQIITIQGTGAAGTAIINSAGQLVGINITAGGSGYSTNPSIQIAGGPPLGGINQQLAGSGPLASTATSAIIGGSPFNQGAAGLPYSPGGSFAATGAGDVVGTASGQDTPAATAQYPYGSGASAIAVTYNGAVVGAVITAQGSGYQVAPALTFVGGNTFSLGMMPHVNMPSAITGFGIGNVRVAGPYQLAVEFVNTTTTGITPTGGTYSFVVTNEFASNSNLQEYVWSAGTPQMALLGAVSATFVEISVTMPGILSTDLVGGWSNQGFSTTIAQVCNVRVPAVSLLGVDIEAGNAAASIYQGEFFNATIWRKAPSAISSLFYTYLAPTTPITANGVYELTYTVTGIQANSAVLVSKGSMTQGISIANSRVTSANNIAIAYANWTSNAITLPTEFYTVESFNDQVPGPGGPGVVAWTIKQVGVTMQSLVDQANEIRDTLFTMGAYKGS